MCAGYGRSVGDCGCLAQNPWSSCVAPYLAKSFKGLSFYFFFFHVVFQSFTVSILNPGCVVVVVSQSFTVSLLYPTVLLLCFKALLFQR